MPAIDRFYYSFYDLDGYHHIIDIYKDAEAVPYTIAKASSDPVSFGHMGDAGKKEWDNVTIQGQSLNFTFFVPRADLPVLDNIFESGYQDFALEYWIESAKVFHGYIKPENLFKPFSSNSPNVEITLNASDGLAELKTTPFAEASGARYQGKYTLLQMMKAALRNTKLEFNFKIQLNCYEATRMTSTQCAFQKAFINSELFHQIDENQQGEAMNCWDVLNSILKIFNCKLRQQLGYWYITNSFEKSSYWYEFGWAALNQISRSSKYNVFDISSYLFDPNAEQQKIHPLKSVLTTAKNENLGGSIIAADLKDKDSWLSTFTSISEIANNRFSLTSSGASDDYLELVTPFAVAASTDNVFLKIRFSFLVEYAIPTGVKVTPQVRIQVKRPNGELSTFISLGSRGIGQVVNFESDNQTIFKITESGNYNIRISIVPNSGGWSAAEFQLWNISILKIVDGELSNYNPTSYTYDRTFSQVNVKGYEELKAETIISDGNEITEVGALFTYDGVSDYLLTTSWKSYLHQEGVLPMKIIDMYSRNILSNRAAYKNFIRISFIDRDHSILLDQILTLGDKDYVFLSYQKSLKSGRGIIEAELVELFAPNYEGYEGFRELGLKSLTLAGTSEVIPVQDGYLQTAHGFIVGNVITYDGSAYILSEINSGYQPIGVVTEILSANYFNLALPGDFISKDIIQHDIGAVYYVHPTIPGTMTTIPTLESTGTQILLARGTTKGLLIDIDLTESSHTEKGKLTGLSDRAVSVVFDRVFTAVPLGNVKVYRMKQASAGKWKKWDVLYYHTVEAWLTVSGFSLQIESTENLTGVIIEYEFKEV